MKSMVAFMAALATLVGAVIFIVIGLNAPTATLHLHMASAHRATVPLLEQWAEENRIDLRVSYRFDNDVRNWLNESDEIDAVWPSSVLRTRPDDGAAPLPLTYRTPVMSSSVVLAVKRSVIQDLEWAGRTDITLVEIIEAMTSGVLDVAMPSPTHSDIGALAYMGLFHAAAGGGAEALNAEDLASAEALDKMLTFLHATDRMVGTESWVGQWIGSENPPFNAGFMTEAKLIDLNTDLRKAERSTVYAIYPVDGVSLLESPLSYVDRGDPKKEEAFLALQAVLETDALQDVIANMGWRSWANLAGADTEIWNSGWGLDPTRALAPAPYPSLDVVDAALRLYQTDLRKPSLTVWVLDLSEGINSEKLETTKEGFAEFLDPERAEAQRLLPSARDIHIILPMGEGVIQPIELEGADPIAQARTLRFIRDQFKQGGEFDAYYGLFEAYGVLDRYEAEGVLNRFHSSIVVFASSPGNADAREALLAHRQLLPYAEDVPIHIIRTNDGIGPLGDMSKLTNGWMSLRFADPVEAMRTVRGFN